MESSILGATGAQSRPPQNGPQGYLVYFELTLPSEQLNTRDTLNFLSVSLKAGNKCHVKDSLPASRGRRTLL